MKRLSIIVSLDENNQSTKKRGPYWCHTSTWTHSLPGGRLQGEQVTWSLRRVFWLYVGKGKSSLCFHLSPFFRKLQANSIFHHKEMLRQNPKLHLQWSPCYFSTLATDPIKAKWLLSFSASMASFLLYWTCKKKKLRHPPQIIKLKHLTKVSVSLELCYNFRFGVLPTLCVIWNLWPHLQIWA